METSEMIALGSLAVAGLALYLNWRTRQDMKAEKQPIVTVEPDTPLHFRVRLRSRSNEGYTAESIRCLWPPFATLGVVRTAGRSVIGHGANTYAAKIDPLLRVKHAGVKGTPTIMGNGDDHFSTIRLWWAWRPGWLVSERLAALRSRISSSHKSSVLVLLRVRIRSETSKTTTMLKSVRVAKPVASKPDKSE